MPGIVRDDSWPCHREHILTSVFEASGEEIQETFDNSDFISFRATNGLDFSPYADSAAANDLGAWHEQQEEHGQQYGLSPGDFLRTFRNYGNTPQLEVQAVHQNPASDVRFRVRTKQVFVCTYQECNKEFGRRSELYRHHRSVHKKARPFKCQVNGCYRSIHGFPRMDKKTDHERKKHALHLSNQPRDTEG